jgi:hypothetical protein
MLSAIGSLGLFTAGMSVRHWGWGQEADVSQVFKRVKSFPLGGGNYLGFYDVAVTPTKAEDKMARICILFTVTKGSYINPLERKTWLLPLHPVEYAYLENKGTKTYLYLFLAAGVFLMVIAYLIYPAKEE